MVNVPAAIAVLVAVLGAIGSVAAAVAVWRQQGIKSSLDVLSKANAELRLANADLHAELANERLERSKLEGKLEVFTDHFAQRILDAVIETIKRMQPMTTMTTITTPTTPTRSPSERTRTGDNQ